MSDDRKNGQAPVPRVAGLDLGGGGQQRPVEGLDAKRRRWHEWVIACVAGKTVIGRLITRARKGAIVVPSGDLSQHVRVLAPVYDFISGFQTTPQGLAEIHRAFPFMALEISELELPSEGVLIVPFTDLSGPELDGMEGCVREAEELAKQQRLARSGLVVANSIPKMPG